MKRVVLFGAILLAPILIALIVLFTRSEPQAGSPPPKPALEAARAELPPSPTLPQFPAASRAPVAPAEGQLVSASPNQICGIVVDAAGEPLEGAACEVLEGRPLGGMAGLVARAPQPRKSLASVRSDQSGGFCIDAPEGFWVLRVVAEGSAPWEEQHLQAGDFRWVRLEPARSLVVLVRDAAGGPVAGADVRLLEGRFEDTNQAVLRLISNGAGAATLDSIPSGNWFVHVSHSDYVSVIEGLPSSDSHARTFEVTLEPGIRITGRVTHSDGRPAPLGTQVLFDTPDGFTSSHAVSCDPDGHFASRVVFAPHKTLEMAALAPGFGESRRDVTLGAALDSGPQREDFVLETVERTVVGRVVNPAGRPLEGVEVYVQPLLSLPRETVITIPGDLDILTGGWPDLGANDPVSSPIVRFRLAMKTDATGSYRVRGLHPRKGYNLLLVSPRYSNASLWAEEAPPGATTDLGTAELRPAGRVWGHVRRHDGTPIEGTRIYSITHTHFELKPNTEIQTRRPSAQVAGLQAITAASGFFSIRPFPEGEFYLVCKGRMFGPYALAEGAELGEIEIVTAEAHRLDTQQAIPIRLDVVDTLGSPVPRAYVEMILVPSESDPANVPAFNNWLWETGTRAGQVELSAPEEGTYEVEVKDLQGLLASESFRVDLSADGLERRVVLAAAPQPAALLEGVVLSSLGETLAGVDVTVIPTTGLKSCSCLEYTTQTDSAGEFSFGHFMRGAHRLVVTDPQERFPSGSYYPARSGEPIIVTLE